MRLGARRAGSLAVSLQKLAAAVREHAKVGSSSVSLDHPMHRSWEQAAGALSWAQAAQQRALERRQDVAAQQQQQQRALEPRQEAAAPAPSAPTASATVADAAPAAAPSRPPLSLDPAEHAPRWRLCTVRGFADGTLVYKFGTVDLAPQYVRAGRLRQERRPSGAEPGLDPSVASEGTAPATAAAGAGGQPSSGAGAPPSWSNALWLAVKSASHCRVSLLKLAAYAEAAGAGRRPPLSSLLDTSMHRTFEKALRKQQEHEQQRGQGAAAAAAGDVPLSGEEQAAEQQQQGEEEGEEQRRRRRRRMEEALQQLPVNGARLEGKGGPPRPTPSVEAPAAVAAQPRPPLQQQPAVRSADQSSARSSQPAAELSCSPAVPAAPLEQPSSSSQLATHLAAAVQAAVAVQRWVGGRVGKGGKGCSCATL